MSHVSERTEVQLKIISNFYKEVLGADVTSAVQKITMDPFSNNLQILGLVAPFLSVDTIRKGYRTKWGIDLLGSHVGDLESVVETPHEYQFFVHEGGRLGDKELLDKSPQEANLGNRMNVVQFLIAQGLARYAPGGFWLNEQGLTITSTRLPEGFVCGHLCPHSKNIRLCFGGKNLKGPQYGMRAVQLVS